MSRWWSLVTLARRQIRREWRLPELRTLAASLWLAVVALGTVASLSQGVSRGLGAGAARLIGADAGMAAAVDPPASWEAQAQRLGLRTSRSASFPTMAFAGDDSVLVDVNAVDADYPLRGSLQLIGADGRPAGHLAPTPGRVYLDHRAIHALALRIGQPVQVGGQSLHVGAELLREPDGGSLFALAPQAVMALADAQSEGLLGPGSRASHRLLVAGPAAAVKAWLAWAHAQPLPMDGHWVGPEQAQDRMRAAFDRAGLFLQLTALLAALLCGVAIALSAQRYASRKQPEVALLRAIGTSRWKLAALLGLSLAWLALPVVLAGVAAAWLASQAIWHLLAGRLGQPPEWLPLAPCLAAAVMALAVLAGFTWPPLARLGRIAPAAVFRDSIRYRGGLAELAYLLPAAVALGLIWYQAGQWLLALKLALSLTAVALASWLVTAGVLSVIRRLPAGRHATWRLGLQQLARRRRLSLIQATALGTGLTALLLLGLVAPALLDNWRTELPAQTPNWFVLNLQDDQRQAFAQTLQQLGASQLNTMPLAVGKLIAINGRPVEQIHFQDPGAQQRASQQLRLSWSAQLPPANRISAGHWPGAEPAEADLSVDQSWQQSFGLKLGDQLRLQVGEATVDARVGSFRQVDWRSFRVNFFLLLDQAHATRLPHTWIASFYLPRAQADRLAGLLQQQANLSLIDISSLLDQIRSLVEQVALAVRAILLLSLLAGALVLASALAASHQERQHEAALLRTLGASSNQLRGVAACEFALLGLICAITSAGACMLAGHWLGRSVFRIEHLRLPWLPVIATSMLAVLIVTLLGLVGTRKVAKTPPMQLLRQH
ncbi:ABC transporter permease [Frateuria aurantia]